MSSVAKHKGNGSSKAVPSTQRQRKIGVPALLLQALTISEAEGKEWDQDELLDTVYWLRQVIAVLSGIVWGIVPLKGLFAFGIFMAAFFGIVIVWLNRQGVDIDDFGGASIVHAEGTPPAIGMFVLAWVISFTAFHS